MARSVWRGTLSFGLVTIPVALYPATEPKDVRFHLFDREGRRVRYRRVVDAGPRHVDAPTPSGDVDVEEREGESVADESRRADVSSVEVPERADERDEIEVDYRDLVRGYEVEPEAFVFLEQSDIERARPEPSRVIDLEQFVRLEDIDPIFFEKSYYVVPAPEAERPYGLLVRALEASGRVGIGRFVLRTKPHLIALRPANGVLVLETLFFGDEVRDARSLVRGLDSRDVTERDVDLATQLIEVLATEWDPAAFSDEYREELLRMIAERTPERVEEADDVVSDSRTRGRIEDLLEALKQSVEEAKAKRKPDGRRAG
jgi:DNA end-binding protein Ku